jgi:arginase
VILKKSIEIVSAPSILGLKPTGVQELGNSLLRSGLSEKLGVLLPVIRVPHLNHLYSNKRDSDSNCINTRCLHDFSLRLQKEIIGSIGAGQFPLVLGGDCSILIGIASALKTMGTYGLVFLDAHADFYDPEHSVTGEVADMELAIVTGKGPELLANIGNLRPYVAEEQVVHIGQRDESETVVYHSPEIRKTSIKCFSLASIEQQGMDEISRQVMDHISSMPNVEFWIHFDADVVSDEENPAVDYRLPGGLSFDQVEYLLRTLLATERMAGMSSTIFNPLLDPGNSIAKKLTDCIINSFKAKAIYK